MKDTGAQLSMTDTKLLTTYDEIADWYDEQVRHGHLIHDFVVPILLAMIGPVRGRRVLDLACGQGVVARQLAELGAEVVGVDSSWRLLEIARAYEHDHTATIE